MQSVRVVALSVLVLCGVACGDDDKGDEPCELASEAGCDDGLVCEEVVGGEPACFAPITITGQIFDLADDSAIEGASVVARDANGAARSDVVFSEADGTYALSVPMLRQEDGQPSEALSVTLRVAADGYQVFPLPPREALPITLDATPVDGGVDAIENAATRVGLIALTSPEGVTVSGSLGEAGAGALVVALVGGAAAATAVADADGNFVLFNVPEGDVQIGAWGQGVYAEPVSVSVGSEGAQEIAIDALSDVGVSVSGKVEIVNAPGGSITSVILVLESTFDETQARGEAPPGLRAAGVSGDFLVERVPPGRYAVLAAFENDGLVRDPDVSIGGTDIVRIDVGSEDVVLDQGFKVTGALAVMSPGADGLETVTGTPTLVWEQDSSEDGYEVRIYDAFGRLIFEDTELPTGRASDPIRYTPQGLTLEPGMIYQFRAWSWSTGGGGAGTRTYLSSTEDLRGTFQVE